MFDEKIIGLGRITRSTKHFLVALLLLIVSTTANAALVTFDAVGSSDVTGFVQFDDTAFAGGNSDWVSNSYITDLSLMVYGYSFDFGDVVATDDTIVDSSGAIPLIVNGVGALAFNGFETIAFFPDGFGVDLDGDASLTLDTDGNYNFYGDNWEKSFAVRWEASTVPEPGTLLLLGLGITGLAVLRRKS